MAGIGGAAEAGAPDAYRESEVATMTVKALFQCWTGPTLVKQIAEKMRDAGLTVTCEGTESVYVVAEGETQDGASWNVLAALCSKHGVDFGLKPRAVRQL